MSSVPVQPQNVHPINPDLPIVECGTEFICDCEVTCSAAQYQVQILEHLKPPGPSGCPEFDLILLGTDSFFACSRSGMGPDGHTASLFPNHNLLKEKDLWVAHLTDSPKPPPERITLTLPVINNAKHVAFVVRGLVGPAHIQATGGAKKEVLAKIFRETPGEEVPSKLIAPKSGNLDWFVDKDAAQLVNQSSL